MTDAHQKIAKILRTTPESLMTLDQTMSALSGKQGVIEKIAQENEVLVAKVLTDLGLKREDSAEVVYQALINQLIRLDTRLFDLLEKPDLSKMSMVCGKLCETALKLYTPPKGLFIKKEKMVKLLEKYKPDNLISHFQYGSIAELVEKEGFSSVVSALRFTQDTAWMHAFFDIAYSELTPDDFEEREVELKILEDKWLGVADKFLEKKYHNVSHLKEYGVIFIIPLRIDTPGETLRLFTLIMHYLHEVPFYSNLFRKYISQPDFVKKLQSLLRGDVPEDKRQATGDKKQVWRIVQRYLAKDNDQDFRLMEPHVNPEAEHWLRAGDDLGRLSEVVGASADLNLNQWTGLDFVGDFFKDAQGKEQLVSFDLIDLIMSLVKKGEIKYLYHQQEALWNKIFSEYMTREKMNELIDEHIIDGFIEV